MLKLKRFLGILLTLIPVVSFGISDPMTLREKVGQMFIVGFHGDRLEETEVMEAIKSDYIGGLILFRWGTHGNVKSPKRVEVLLAAAQGYSMKLGRLPLLIAIDQEGGIINTFGEDGGFAFKNYSPRELGEINDLKLTEWFGHEQGKLLKEAGVHLNLAPVVDLGVDENNFIYRKGRIYSKEKEGVIKHAEAYIAGLRRAGIVPCLKHFPGHGSSRSDTHYGMSDVTETWGQAELDIFKEFIEKGYRDPIMTAHVINRKIEDGVVIGKKGEDVYLPMTLSKKGITDLLKGQLGHEGLVISDALDMGAIRENFRLEQTLELGINAGVDLFLVENHYECQTRAIVDTVVGLVQAGKISEDRIDESYHRIINLKKRVGLIR